VIEGAGRAAGDLVHCGGDGRVVELAGAEEAEERVDEVAGVPSSAILARASSSESGS